MSRRIVYVGAHCDDAEIWAGGTLIKHKQEGDDIFLAIRDHSDDNRKREQKEASSLVGFEHAYYSTRNDLEYFFSNTVPDVLITHWDDDSHTDHRATNQDAITSIKKIRQEFKKPLRFFSCDTYNKIGLHGEFNPSMYVDISDFIDKKRELIHCFKSQNPTYWTSKVELITALYGSRCRNQHSEGFKEFSLLGSAFSSTHLL